MASLAPSGSAPPPPPVTVAAVAAAPSTDLENPRDAAKRACNSAVLGRRPPQESFCTVGAVLAAGDVDVETTEDEVGGVVDGAGRVADRRLARAARQNA